MKKIGSVFRWWLAVTSCVRKDHSFLRPHHALFDAARSRREIMLYCCPASLFSNLRNFLRAPATKQTLYYESDWLLWIWFCSDDNCCARQTRDVKFVCATGTAASCIINRDDVCNCHTLNDVFVCNVSDFNYPLIFYCEVKWSWKVEIK